MSINMTEQEYIEIMDNSNFLIDSANPYDMEIKKALEKQIPKKPTQVDKWGEFFQCPRCNGFVTDYFGCKMKYCSRCGQALKWESEE